MNIILFDDLSRISLLPLTFTKPVAKLRVGISCINEKWEYYLQGNFSYLTADYLSKKFPINIEADNYFINGKIIPDKTLSETIKNLKVNQCIKSNDSVIAFRCGKEYAEKHSHIDEYFDSKTDNFEIINYEGLIESIDNTWDIFSKNAKIIKSDFEIITAGRQSEAISPTNRIIKPENVFIEKGGKCEMAIINAEEGPVYIGKDAEIMENSVIRGPFAMLDHSVVKMSAKIYSSCTIGPHSKVGGELNNVVIQGYSNKAHDGFLGNSVIGEWCNLGADTNNSNLKNTYEEVRLWNYLKKTFVKTNLQFCGLIMGDHSKCGINTMFNTGTVVGVGTNIFGSGYQRNFIPSFSWGGREKMINFELDKFFEIAEKVMLRRNITLSTNDKEILSHIFATDKR